ncbi:MAG: 6-phosphogluconate dehydrogenase (decarboxylating) [Nitrospinae bacterium CG11_big_fil_rev_8_21_14_0_20_56_8]|nr:MAG: 6-phosphogluconate dehydrogenase (decarboxylating) [Nitrospinae bacterium CG11_big_fil_rev_8_21_14_0_20_56_8]
MKIGFVGLGKMGGNMVERLLNGGHEVVVFDRSPEMIALGAEKGAEPSASLADLISRLPEKKVVWLMVPAGEGVDECIHELEKGLLAGDILVDGGNSNWKDSRRRSHDLFEKKGLHLVDCGTSGGVWGLQNGYCLMYGGHREACHFLEPVLRTLAPANGYLHCGGSGAGHFVKMVHNGIEYGLMQAYAEGFEILEHSPFELDVCAVSQLWQHGSVVRSWLLELAARAFAEDPKLTGIKDYVQDSGEGRWTVQTAMELDVPVPVIAHSLFARFQSRQPESFAMKVISALRNQFGGHNMERK